MKKPSAFEAAAAIAAILGSFMLVAGLMPFINPGMLEVRETWSHSSIMAFLFPILLSAPILGAAWHFNKKARDMKHQQQIVSRNVEAPWERKLKWIIFGIVALLVLLASFW